MIKTINQSGFTLIELLIVVAIVGVLASIALPSYQQFTIRTRLSEGLGLASGAKKLIEVEGAISQFDLDIAVTTWNSRAGNLGATSKYVNSVLFPAAPNSNGVITITYNAVTTGIGAAQNTLVLAPFIRTGLPGNQPSLAIALANGISGPIDWACASTTNITAASQGMPAPLGTVLSVFAPSQCR